VRGEQSCSTSAGTHSRYIQSMDFVYCGQLDALEGFAWMEWWVLSPIDTVTFIVRCFQGPYDDWIHICDGHRCTSCTTRGWVWRSGCLLVDFCHVISFVPQFESPFLFLANPLSITLPWQVPITDELTVLEQTRTGLVPGRTWGYARVSMFVVM
jgi:hypothetical protein